MAGPTKRQLGPSGRQHASGGSILEGFHLGLLLLRALRLSCHSMEAPAASPEAVESPAMRSLCRRGERGQMQHLEVYPLPLPLLLAVE